MLMQVILPSLLLTLACECAVGFFWGLRKRREYLVLCLVNILTNLALNIGLVFLRTYVYYKTVNLLTYVFEILIFIAEALLYRKFLKNFRHPFLLSLTANLASYGAGVLVSLLLWHIRGL